MYRVFMVSVTLTMFCQRCVTVGSDLASTNPQDCVKYSQLANRTCFWVIQSKALVYIMYRVFMVSVTLTMFCQWCATVGNDLASANPQDWVNKYSSTYYIKKSSTKQIIPQVHHGTVFWEGSAPTSKVVKGTHNLRGLRSPRFRCNCRIAPDRARQVLSTPSWT
jgi:hypothetical protein